MTKGLKMLVVLWVFVLTCLVNLETTSSLSTEFKWKYFDYVWKSPEQEKWYKVNKHYIPRDFTPIDVDRSSDGRTFVTIIRTVGVPATLHTVSKNYSASGPLLEPYPDWTWYNPIDPCNGLINVYRVAIDNCNRMWVLDVGSIDFQQICPVRLLVFNLHTNKLIFWQALKNNVAYSSKRRSLLITPIVDTEGLQCEDTTVYIADVLGHALIVWRNFEAVRLENEEMFGPQSAHTAFNIDNVNFTLQDGLFGMSLSPKISNDLRYLVFRPLASLSVHAVTTEQLKNSVKGGKVDYITGKDVLPSQASTMAFASDGTLFYGLTKHIAIGCWNIKFPMLAEYFKIAVTDHDRLQFASGMKVIKNSTETGDEYLLIMTNKYHKYVDNTININEYNYHVLSASVKDLVKTAGCDK